MWTGEHPVQAICSQLRNNTKTSWLASSKETKLLPAAGRAYRRAPGGLSSWPATMFAVCLDHHRGSHRNSDQTHRQAPTCISATGLFVQLAMLHDIIYVFIINWIQCGNFYCYVDCEVYSTSNNSSYFLQAVPWPHPRMEPGQPIVFSLWGQHIHRWLGLESGWDVWDVLLYYRPSVQ